jgi:UDP-N-acetylglucosamine--N-acetylmuramyl-(pentapeptide) pyrophosphoryl-undecaprenol N-acetylglucosamine transferase
MKTVNVCDFFSSPIGLGHVTRDIAIVSNFENISVNFVTGSGAAKILKKLDYKLEDVYSPPSFIVENGILNNQNKWLWNYFQYYKKCKKISEKIIKKNNSNLIISDEDFASLTVAQNLKIPNILITDVLETKFTKGIASFIERKMNKSMMKIIKNCNLVIIPEEGDDQDNIRRTGPIVRETNLSREELRRKFSFDKTTIVISIGGTSAGLFLIDKAIESILKINQDIEIVVVSGPSVTKKFDNVKNLGFIDNLHELISASDLIISLAGKSTIDEAKAYGTPGIFIPIKDHFEQEDNAKIEGFVFEDINRLDELILEKLEEKRNKVNTDGTKLASEIIRKLIKEKSNS